MTSATRTALFTDLTDYSARVSHVDREGLRRILLQHEQMVRPIVERFHGRVVKNIGDSFLCLFPAATDALRACLEIQQSLPADEAPGIRLAVNTGDVEEIDGDAFGDPVNIAARILAKCPPGEAWFGYGTRVCMNDAEIPWESVGRLRLKGIPGEYECFRVVPENTVWLPHGVKAAARSGRLARVRRGERIPELPADPVILLEGFEPGAAPLDALVHSLPILDPASFFLCAYRIASDDRLAWSRAGHGLVVGTCAAVNAALARLRKPAAVRGRLRADDATMALDVRSLAALELRLSGIALPSVPFSEVVASYFYDLQPDGRWVARSDRAVVRVEVTPDGVLLHALQPDVSVDGRLLAPGQTVTLEPPAVISTPAGTLHYHDADAGYAGVIVGDGGVRLGVLNGQTAELGRKPNPPGLAFPGGESQDNLRWCAGARAARARGNGFTLDRVLAGRRQAAVRVLESLIELVPLHEECPTYVLRAGKLERVEEATALHFGDYVVAGTTVIAVGDPG